MLPLPLPEKGGNIEDLRGFLNLQTDEDWVLFLAAQVAALFSQGPFPILGLHGEAGSAKTTAARVFRKMVDPNVAPSRGQAKDPRDLMIAANNGWQLSFDNLSYLPAWFSDCLCRLSSGAGFSTRQLYTDSGEVLFEGQRPIVLNGIEELATRTDLIDRSILLELPVIRQYREEQKFWKQFEAAQPKLLGALLDVAVQAIQELPNVKLTEQPRMADFAKLGTAIEPALGLKSGTFLRAYTSNRKKASRVALDASPIANRICELAVKGWTGTATQLLSELNSTADEEVRRTKSWPKSPRVLSGMLKRLNTAFRTVGTEVESSRDDTRMRNRELSIRKLKAKGKGAV